MVEIKRDVNFPFKNIIDLQEYGNIKDGSYLKIFVARNKKPLISSVLKA
jgi:hypothetical protein